MPRTREPAIVTVAAVVLLALTCRPAAAAVILTLDRSEFLVSNRIVSTETFDEFPHPTAFPSTDQSVTIDSVVYFDPSPVPAWILDTVSPSSLNSLLAGGSLEDKTIAFLNGGYVRALGFDFIAFGHAVGGDARFHFVVEEIDGTITDFFRSPPDGFLGFSSARGIRLVSVTQEGVSGVRTNFAFDNVSRTAVVPEPPAVVLGGVAGLCLMLRRRRRPPRAADNVRP